MSSTHRHDREATRRNSDFIPGKQERRSSATSESKATSFIQTLFRKKTKEAKGGSLPSPTTSVPSFSTDSADEYEDTFTLCLSFAALAERKDAFPQQVTVRFNDPEGENVHQVLRESGVFNLHFVKDTSYVLMTNGDECVHRLPLNSSLRFSPLHFASESSSVTESPSIDRALEGRCFSSVGEILAHPKLPMVVAVTEKTKGCPFDAWEILVIKRAKQRRQNRQRYLVIHSLLTGKEVNLDDGSELRCSTKPDHFQLYVSQIVQHMQLPMKVKVNKDEANPACSLLESKIFTLQPGGSVRSVIATRTDSPQRVLEIQADVKMNVSLLHPNLQVANDLLKRSLEMYEDFSSVCVEEYVLGEEYEEDLFSQVCDPEVGIELYKPQQLASQPDHVEDEPESVSEADYMIHETASENDYVLQPADDDDDGGVAYDTVPVLPPLIGLETSQAMVEAMHDDIQRLQCTVEEMKTGFYSLEKEMRSISNRLATMEATLHSSPLQQTTYSGIANHQYATIPCHSNPDASATDTESLLALDNNQILKLLDQLNLTTYKENFRREQIDGWLFMELNDDILQYELGVTSRLHRLKLIRVMEGKLKVDWSLCSK